MIKAEQSVVVHRPLHEVFAFMTNYAETHPRWSPKVEEMRQTSAGPMGVGSTYWHARRDAGRRTESILEVAEFEPNQKISIRSRRGAGGFSAIYTFAIAEGGTRVNFVRELTTSGFMRLLEPIIASQVRRDLAADTERFKHLLENPSN